MIMNILFDEMYKKRFSLLHLLDVESDDIEEMPQMKE